jgi:hydroxyacylglutathione hydrolase
MDADQPTPLKAAILPVTPFQQNCSLVWCTETNKGAVIDPGGEVDRILSAIEEAGFELEKILLTHGHLDHAGGAMDLKDRTGVPIVGPQKDEAFWLDQITAQSQQFGLPGGRDCTPDQWLEDGGTVTVGNLEFDVIHCPGHTPGHVVFVHKPSKLAIVGDVLFQGSIGRTDFPKGDHDTLIRSITEKLWPLGEDIAFIPGHGPMSTFGQERQHNPFVGDRALA